MFEAYSVREEKIVNVKKCYNANEIFRCPDPYCKGELKLKSINGKKAKHFSCVPGLVRHSDDCTYSIPQKYTDKDPLVKYSIESIMNSTQEPNEDQGPNKKVATVSGSSRQTLYIRTPKQLLNYCLTHDLSTEYVIGKTINDIIVDYRNVGHELYKGFSGIRLVVGKTISFDQKDNSISFVVRSHSIRRHLVAKIYVTGELRKKIIKHYLETYNNKFSRHNIAVLADWKTDSKYNISARIEHDRNVIVRFK